MHKNYLYGASAAVRSYLSSAEVEISFPVRVMLRDALRCLDAAEKELRKERKSPLRRNELIWELHLLCFKADSVGEYIKLHCRYPQFLPRLLKYFIQELKTDKFLIESLGFHRLNYISDAYSYLYQLEKENENRKTEPD